VNDKERLEEIKNVSEFQIDNDSYYGRPANVILNGDDVRWLIKQAERVQELEELKDRYREAIENVLKDFGVVESLKYAAQLKKALEESE